MRKHPLSFFMLLVVLCVIAPATFAQVATTGSISGTVKDSQGAFVPDASITIRDTATGKQSNASTNDEGTRPIKTCQPPTIQGVDWSNWWSGSLSNEPVTRGEQSMLLSSSFDI